MATFQCGDHIGHFPIDGCFVMLDIVPNMATWLCPGVHCFVILDFWMDVLDGDHILWVVHPEVSVSAVWILDISQFSPQPPLALH